MKNFLNEFYAKVKEVQDEIKALENERTWKVAELRKHEMGGNKAEFKKLYDEVIEINEKISELSDTDFELLCDAMNTCDENGWCVDFDKWYTEKGLE